MSRVEPSLPPIETLAPLYPDPTTDVWRTPPPPPERFVVLPPGCVCVYNVVAQIKLSRPFSGDDIMRAYWFCQRNSKNHSVVIMHTLRPDGTVSMYGARGMMVVVGNNIARRARYTADVYLRMIQRAGYPDMRVADFRVNNLTANVALPGAFDAAACRRELLPDLVYIPSNFPAARKRARRTGALVSFFVSNAVILGARSPRDLCLEARDEIEAVRDFVFDPESERGRALLEGKKKKKPRHNPPLP